MIREFWIVAMIVFIMGGGGIAHLLWPHVFVGFIFEPLPPIATVIASGLVELGIATLALIPSTRAVSGLFFAILCAGYMPLHIWDLFRDDPVISPLWLASLRIVLQLFFIWSGWRLWRRAALS